MSEKPHFEGIFPSFFWFSQCARLHHLVQDILQEESDSMWMVILQQNFPHLSNNLVEMCIDHRQLLTIFANQYFQLAIEFQVFEFLDPHNSS